ncbi:hypothetical protein PR048_011988 [Dryococelus australis]|uniref:HTH psq-type domain-containing protein n=1 Tax=Dryococelus australis TaxID=614101 RepID=A0ABQ9HPD0_9NEOP|nr:hypothetical protein PR048_011988 [Dryococelus australis]
MGKVDQRKWIPSKITKAIDAVWNKKMGWKKASKQFNVPKTTLMRLPNVKYGTPEEAAKTIRGRSTVLGKDLEEELVHYCLAVEAPFFFFLLGFLVMTCNNWEREITLNILLKTKLLGKSELVFFLNTTKSNCQKGSLLEHPIAVLLGSAKKTHRNSTTFWKMFMRKLNSLPTEFTMLMRVALLWYNLE